MLTDQQRHQLDALVDQTELNLEMMDQQIAILQQMEETFKWCRDHGYLEEKEQQIQQAEFNWKAERDIEKEAKGA